MYVCNSNLSMAASSETLALSKWGVISITLTLATLSVSTAIYVYSWTKKSRQVNLKLQQLEVSLKACSDKCAAERQGRIRAQQDLRKALLQSKSEKSEWTSYPMSPIATIQSCFSTRNGAPRQPLLVPLARATLVFDSAQAPPASLEGLEEYSHCWILYVFHLNTDLEKLWKHPSRSKFKAKVRVPRLKGEKKGVFATRSPHRPCPIGLTVAKVEEVKGNMVQLSGIDLVDGTPVLDIKPYLPYCDNIEGAKVPKWVEVDDLISVASVNFADGFFTSLTDCWTNLERKSLYGSPNEFKNLIRQVLSWDIRSVSQRNAPHDSQLIQQNGSTINNSDVSNHPEDESNESSMDLSSNGDKIYHLILEGLNVAYKIDCESNVYVHTVTSSNAVRRYPTDPQLNVV
ncbi:uncharacterized protein LOC108220893 [Daucus carota subsp. sativus]|nr:PREDICTED: uncharacterized protein LOC108220893 [Daucus carota subsp. sativus]